MSDENFKNYLRSQQVSLQWLPVLRALAAELSENASPEGLRQLFFKVGGRFAEDIASRFEDVQTLDDLCTELNEFWAQLNWGWVSFEETDGFIQITHEAAPLAEAFGDESLVWSVGLLEGFYQNVFTVLGAGEAMTVHAVDEACVDMMVQLQFGNHDA